MAASLPRHITARPLVDGVRYILPRRRIGMWHWVGLVPMGIGLVFCGFGAGSTIRAVQAFLAGSGGPGHVIAALFGLPFLIVGLLPLGLGLFILAGHSEIALRRKWIGTTERCGPFRWTRRRPTAALKKLIVHADSRTRRRQSTPRARSGADLAMLEARFTSGRPLRLAPGYPRAWLEALAGVIRDHEGEQFVDVRPADGDVTAVRAPVAVETVLDDDEERSGGVEVLRPVPRPAGSRVGLDQTADGLTITIPPAGIWRGSKGLFSFALLWCGFMTVFSGFTVIGPLLSGTIGQAIPFVFGSLLFWGVGIAMLVGAINMGRRRAIIDVVGDVLLVNRRSLFGLRSHEWAAADLVSIRVGPSGMETNGVPILNVQVQPRVGSAVGLFAGREPQELRWLAWELSVAMRLTGDDAAPPGPAAEGA